MEFNNSFIFEKLNKNDFKNSLLLLLIIRKRFDSDDNFNNLRYKWVELKIMKINRNASCIILDLFNNEDPMTNPNREQYLKLYAEKIISNKGLLIPEFKLKFIKTQKESL